MVGTEAVVLAEVDFASSAVPNSIFPDTVIPAPPAPSSAVLLYCIHFMLGTCRKPYLWFEYSRAAKGRSASPLSSGASCW